jgi:hypothetical protein
MRALAALRMVWASAVWMAVEMLATWCVRKLCVNVTESILIKNTFRKLMSFELRV